jgi:hypothetical protein
MHDEYLKAWLKEFSEQFYAMEEYQGQTEFLNEHEFRMFNMAKELFMNTFKTIFDVEVK